MMKEKPVRPDFVTDEMLEFLDGLRESGVTNMWGAAPYLEDAFDELRDERPSLIHSSKMAGEALVYWMNTFGQADR